MSFIKIIQSKFLILITSILAILGFFLYSTSTRKINFNPEKIARIEVFSKERKIKDINSPNKIDDIVKILIGMGVVTFLSLKKFGLGIIVSVSLVMIFLFDLVKIYL